MTYLLHFVTVPALALVVINACAQTAPITVDSNAIMGFETPATWSAKSSNSANITVTSTPTRTQGNSAYALGSPGNQVSLTSLPVASTATALAGIGNLGAILEVDVSLPSQQGNQVNAGYLQLYVNSPSRGLSKVSLGQVFFNGFRLGAYNTLKFSIPDAVRTALGAAAFSDLTFQLSISSPGTITGAYLFDNLRVHSVGLVTANAGTRPPPGYGGSVELTAIGNTPAVESFDAGPVQVPAGFHLKLGTVGGTTAQLALGFDGKPAFTCTYARDTTDVAGKSYIFSSCTGAFQAGDLVGAGWAQLTIVGGDSTMKIRAQLARSPMGDQVGSGLLPAMPTFWGDFDTCVPAPFAGKVDTISPSCTAQMAEANQIATNYFNKVNNTPTVPPGWVVTPVPEFAKRHGDGAPYDTSTGPPPPNDPDFDKSGSLNPGGNFDAGYHTWGNISYQPPDPSNSNHATAHAEASVAANLVVFGHNVDAARLTWSVDADSGPITVAGIGPPAASGSLHCFVFGSELSNNGPSDITAQGFTFNCHNFTEYNGLGSIDLWIFSIKPGPTIGYGLTTSGTVKPNGTGFSVTVAPDIDLGVHVFGGVDIGIASGGVDARVDLLDIVPQFTAAVSWNISTNPDRTVDSKACSAGLTYSGTANLQLSSGGGGIYLVASFPFYDDSWGPIVSWNPLVSHSFPIFGAGNTLTYPLPVSLCTAPLSVTITNPADGQTVPAGSVNLSATAFSTNGGGIVTCNNSVFQWSSGLAGRLGDDSFSPNPPGDGTGCNVSINFTQPASSESRTITLQATHTYTDSFDRAISESGQATPLTITVNPLSAGDNIISLFLPNAGGVSGGGRTYSFSSATTPPSSPPIDPTGSAVPYTFKGKIIGATGPTLTTWTVTDSNNVTTTIDLDDAITFPCDAADPTIVCSLASWRPASFNGFFLITMASTVNGTALAPSTVQVQLTTLH